MAKYAPDIYASSADLQAALEAIDTTTTVQVVAFFENGKQKFMVIK